MNVKEQIKQKVISLSMRAEDFFHRFRSRLEGAHKDEDRPRSPRRPDSGHVQTYYNTSKEERKLH